MNSRRSIIGIASATLLLGIVLPALIMVSIRGYIGAKGMNLRGKDGLLYIESNFSSISKWLDKSRTKAEVAYVVGLPSNKFEEDIWVWTSKEPNISVDNNRTKAVSSLNISGGGYFLEFNGGFSKGEIKSLVAYIEEFNVKSGRAK